MANFHGLCPRSCTLALGYIGGIQELRKLDFRSLKAKVGYLKPILTSRTYLWPISMDYAISIDCATVVVP